MPRVVERDPLGVCAFERLEIFQLAEIPQLHAVPRGGGHVIPVLAEAEGRHRPDVALHLSHALLRLDVPHLDRRVRPGGGEDEPIRVKPARCVSATRPRVLVAHHGQRLRRAHVVERPRAIRAERYRVGTGRMGGDGGDFALVRAVHRRRARLSAPHAKRLIRRGGEQRLPGPRQPAHALLMLRELTDALTLGRVEERDGTVRAAGGDHVSVRGVHRDGGDSLALGGMTRRRRRARERGDAVRGGERGGNLALLTRLRQFLRLGGHGVDRGGGNAALGAFAVVGEVGGVGEVGSRALGGGGAGGRRAGLAGGVLGVGEGGAGLVAFLHETRDDAAGGVVLVEGVGELLSGGVEIFAELVGLEHERVPLVVEDGEHAGDGGGARGLGLHRLVHLDREEVIEGERGLGHGAFAGLLREEGRGGGRVRWRSGWAGGKPCGGGIGTGDRDVARAGRERGRGANANRRIVARTHLKRLGDERLLVEVARSRGDHGLLRGGARNRAEHPGRRQTDGSREAWARARGRRERSDEGATIDRRVRSKTERAGSMTCAERCDGGARRRVNRARSPP